MNNEITYKDGLNDYRLSRPTSINELLSELMVDMGNPEKCYVWRGQKCCTWKPFPGMYRRLQANYRNEQINERLIRDYENDLFAEANGLVYIDACGGSRLEFMIQLQHDSAATLWWGNKIVGRHPRPLRCPVLFTWKQ